MSDYGFHLKDPGYWIKFPNVFVEGGKTQEEVDAEHGYATRMEFRWNSSFGNISHVHTRWLSSIQDAHVRAREMAIELGYDNPRWWQFWRWGDPRLPGGPLETGESGLDKDGATA